jgi:hypothetical protein
MDHQRLIAGIEAAFRAVEHPGDWNLTDSLQGDEPLLLVQVFKGKHFWSELDAAFLDQAPDGYGSALSFFSIAAFRFYLPAYMICDVKGALPHLNVAFHLTHGLLSEDKDKKVNERLYGQRTLRDDAMHRFSVFDRSQSATIADYLHFKAVADPCSRRDVEEALANFWSAKAGL